jgi:hypothetical protein
MSISSSVLFDVAFGEFVAELSGTTAYRALESNRSFHSARWISMAGYSRGLPGRRWAASQKSIQAKGGQESQ